MNPTNGRKTRGDLVHQIVTVLVKNNAQVTPDTAWVHDFTELITAHTNAEIAKATTAARIDELEQAMSENAPFGEGQQDIAVQYIEYRIAELQSERAKLKEVK